MKRIIIATVVVGALTTIACSGSETSAPASELAVTMASAFSAAPAGYSNLNSSYVGDEGKAFAPDFTRDQHRGGPRFHLGGRGRGPGFGLGFMGGGLFGGFMGNGFARAVFAGNDPSCEFANGIVTCDPVTRFGLTVNRSYEYKDSAGTAQPKFDRNTSAVTATVTVAGSSTRRDSSTSSIDLASTQSVSGLGPGSTGLTINSASHGKEEATGISREGPFTAKRVAGDTVQGVVVPFPGPLNFFVYPTAGKIIRSMSVEVTISGQTKVSSNRREVITYDGSDRASVEITLDGETQVCTLPLPFGRLSCPDAE